MNSGRYGHSVDCGPRVKIQEQGCNAIRIITERGRPAFGSITPESRPCNMIAIDDDILDTTRVKVPLDERVARTSDLERFSPHFDGAGRPSG